MFALYKKELHYYLNNPIGYIILVLFGVFANFWFLKDIFVINSASMKPFFAVLPWIYLVFIPALTMRSVSEEKRTNTIETLLTLPISETQIILAKFGALVTLVLIGLILTLGLPISLYLLTSEVSIPIYLPEVLIGYLGVFLVGALFTAISLFFSSQTKNQVIAFLLSAFVLFILNVLVSDFMGFLPKAIQDILAYTSPNYHVQNFTKGVVDLRSMIYFISTTGLALFFSIVELEKRD